MKSVIVASMMIWVMAGCHGGGSQSEETPKTSTEETCLQGQVKLEDTCCWQGQTLSKGACTGIPTSCPSDLEPTPEGCLQIPDGMVLVPSGPFIMGCNPSTTKCLKHEPKAHTVTLDGFLIDKTEVTVAAYKRCVDAKACEEPQLIYGGDPDANNTLAYNWNAPGRENHPINGVTFKQARGFCKWKGAQLPTKEQWEKAARGTDGRLHPWGNDEATCEHAVMWDCPDLAENSITHKVGSKKTDKSPYGVLDMSGNIWEWTQTPLRTVRQGKLEISDTVVVVKGTFVGGKRISNETASEKGMSADFIGFRCARPLGQ